MRLEFLNHLLDSIQSLCGPERIVIIGSGSLLPFHPELGGTCQPLEITRDADFIVEPLDELNVVVLKEAVGKGSGFEQKNGYYADILRPAIEETLPAGWRDRLRPLPGRTKVFALDLYDLALVKLLVGRPKDLELLRALLNLGLLDLEKLRGHYHAVPLREPEAFTASRNLHALMVS